MELETREMSVELLQELSLEQQVVLAWQCVGFSEAEIDTITGLSMAMVHSLLASGKAKLRIVEGLSAVD